MNTQYIYDLLLDNDYVTIPGLGGFVCEYQSAVVQRYSSEIVPPSRKIAFNKALNQNDGLLVQYIVLRESLSYKEAEEKVRAFASACNLQLRQMGSLQIPKIGRLYSDESQQVHFSPSHESLPLDDSFGLPNVGCTPIPRILEEQEELVAAKSVSDTAKVLPVQRQQKSWLYWAAASVAGIFLAGTVWMNLGQPPVKNLVSADFYSYTKVVLSDNQNILPFSGNGHIKTETIGSFTGISTENRSAEEETIAEEIAESFTPKYPIVVGAFRGPITARNFKDDLAAKGYESEVLEPVAANKLYKVIVRYEAADEEEAVAAIRRDIDPFAWLLD